MNDISVPYLLYSEVRNIADKFLNQYHPSLDIPIPIEEIIEFKMGIDIFPMHGLSTDFSGNNLEVDGYTSLHRKTITVDNWIYQNRLSRYRFTLAHEVGHIVMHKKLYESIPFKNIDEWKAFIRNFHESEYKKFEWQAYAFAGLILVPGRQLERAIDLRLNEAMEIVKQQGMNPQDVIDFVWSIVYENVGHDFEVSPIVIDKRVEFDKLKDKYK